MIIYGVAFVSAALLSAVFTFVVRDTARRRGWTCKRPITDRDIHTKAVPRLGGIPIAGALLVVVALLSPLLIKLSKDELTLSQIAFLMIPGMLICGVGLLDDIYGLSAPQKLAAETVAAMVLFLGGYRVVHLPLLFGSHDFGVVASLGLTIFWVLLVTNSFNLIDGVDGLSAGTAWISVMVVFIVAALGHQDSISFLAAALAGTILGFLPFNFNPATVFLGDCGSLLIGFMLSALALAGTQKAVVALVVPLVTFAVPLIDTVLAIVRRFLNNKPLFAADRDHIHHKLLQKGLSQRQVVVLLYAVSAAFGFMSLALLRPASNKEVVLVIVAAAVVAAMGVRRLGYDELSELRMATRRTIRQKQMITNNLALRRAIADLKAANTLRDICNSLNQACQQSDFETFEMTLEATDAPTGDLDTKYLRFEPGTIRFTCSKHPNVLRPWDSTAGWTVQLDLVIDNCHRGSFTAYRPYGARALALEMNLFVADFRIALVSAVDRAARQLETRHPPRQAVASHTLVDQHHRGSLPHSRRNAHE